MTINQIVGLLLLLFSAVAVVLAGVVKLPVEISLAIAGTTTAGVALVTH